MARSTDFFSRDPEKEYSFKQTKQPGPQVRTPPVAPLSHILASDIYWRVPLGDLAEEQRSQMPCSA